MKVPSHVNAKARQDAWQDTNHQFGKSVLILCDCQVALVAGSTAGTSALVSRRIASALAPFALARAGNAAWKAEIEYRAEFLVLSAQTDSKDSQLHHLLKTASTTREPVPAL